MEFIIGSTNPAKVKAVQRVIASHFPKAIISEVDVKSGVSDQPFGMKRQDSVLSIVHYAQRGRKKM